MKTFSLAQALLAVSLCVLPRYTPAETRESVSGFAFDGFGGYAFLGHTHFLGTFQDEGGYTSLTSQQDLGGVLRTGLRYSDLEARLGLGGILFYPRPIGSSEVFAHNRVVKFLPGLDEAALRLAFPWAGPTTALELGRFRFRTNPDAVLFGEYLARYGAYPGSVERSQPRWDSLGFLTNRVDALRFTWDGSPLRSDFLWLWDSSAVEGRTDFSFALFLEGTLARGFTWGAGGELFRALSTEPEGLTPNSVWNGYVKTDSGYVLLSDRPFDTVPRPREDTGYYTRSAGMFSVRAAVDFGDLYGTEAEGAGGWRDWRVFAEGALLGWGNQPLFYENRWSRLALTIGAHAPTGGWLDDLCFQAERHPRHYRLFRYPSQYRPVGSPLDIDLKPKWLEESESEKWSWGAFAAKSVGDHLSVQLQCLFRPYDDKSYYWRSVVFEDPYSANGNYDASFSLRLQARI